MNISVGDQFAVLNATMKKTQFKWYIQLEEYMIRVLEMSPVGENYIRLTVPVGSGGTRDILVNNLELLTFSPRVER